MSVSTLSFAGLDTFFLLFLERLGVRKLEAFFGMLVGIMTISFGVMYVKADVPADEVLTGVLLPRLSYVSIRDFVLLMYPVGNPEKYLLVSKRKVAIQVFEKRLTSF